MNVVHVQFQTYSNVFESGEGEQGPLLGVDNDTQFSGSVHREQREMPCGHHDAFTRFDTTGQVLIYYSLGWTCTTPFLPCLDST